MRPDSFLVPGAREKSFGSYSRPKLDGIWRFAVKMTPMPCPAAAKIFIGVRLLCILGPDQGIEAAEILANGSEHEDMTRRDTNARGSIQEFLCARADTISPRPAA